MSGTSTRDYRWISSTLHAGVDERGTANTPCAAWRIWSRYAGETFRTRRSAVQRNGHLDQPAAMRAMVHQRHSALTASEITTAPTTTR